MLSQPPSKFPLSPSPCFTCKLPLKLRLFLSARVMEALLLSSHCSFALTPRTPPPFPYFPPRCFVFEVLGLRRDLTPFLSFSFLSFFQFFFFSHLFDAYLLYRLQALPPLQFRVDSCLAYLSRPLNPLFFFFFPTPLLFALPRSPQYLLELASSSTFGVGPHSSLP